MTNKKPSKNYLINLLAADAAKAVDGIQEKNPFIAGILDEIAVDRKNVDHPGYHGVIEITKLLRLTKLECVLTNPKSIDGHPEAFWKLMDEAKRQDCLSATPRAVTALLKLYINFDKRGYLGKTFYSHPLSPKDVLRTRPFKEFLLNNFCHSEDTYLLTYSQNKHPRYLTLRYKNKALCEMVVNAFTQSLNKYDRKVASMNVLYVFESWFGKAGAQVKDYKDLDEKLLTAGIQYIKEHYEDEMRKDNMRFLFHFYKCQMLMHPEHDFFRNSHIWTSSLVLDRRIPLHIADGYKFAVFGQASDIDQQGGVLMVVRDGHLRSANGRSNRVFMFDMKDITEPTYWKALSRYIIRNSYLNITYLRTFLLWLQDWKKTCGTDPLTITSVDTNEYRTQMTHLYSNGNARNNRQNHISLFLRWADDENLIHVMPGAIAAFEPFPTKYVTAPGPLSKRTITKIRETLKEMGRETQRYLLVEAIIRLIVTTEVRVGQLCSLRTDTMKFQKNGIIYTYSRRKNGGHDQHEQKFLPRCADIIREVYEMTEPTRRQCPAGSFENMLFVYKDAACSQMPFGVLTTNKVGQDIREACLKAGLEPVTCGNFRDTYMTAVTAFARKHKLTELQQAMLTKHANKYSTRSYSRVHLDEILRAAKDITI